MELLNQGVSLCLTFWGTAKLFSKVAAIFYVSVINVYEGSNLSISLPILVSVCLFYYSHPSICEEVSNYGWTHISLMNNHQVKHLFMCLLAILYLLWKNVYSNTLPHFNCCCYCFLNCWVAKSLYIFWIILDNDCLLDIDLQIFPPFYTVSWFYW